MNNRLRRSIQQILVLTARIISLSQGDTGINFGKEKHIQPLQPTNNRFVITQTGLGAALFLKEEKIIINIK